MAWRIEQQATLSLVPRPSSRAVDPLPQKLREEGLVKLIT